MNQRLDELMRSADPADFADQPAISADRNDPLYLSILAKRGDVMTVDKQTKPALLAPRRRRRGVLVAAAAFAVVLVIGVALALLSSGSGEPEPAATSTSTTTTTTEVMPDAARLEDAASAAIAVAEDAGYEAAQQAWRPQLTFVTGGPVCQLETDAVQFTELDNLTSGQTMVAMTLDDSSGSVEVLQFADPAIAGEAVPIFQRLLQTRRGCMADGLQTRLGNAFGDDEFTTIDIEGALGGYLYSSEHDDGSGRVAHVQVVGAIEGDWLYIITFRSNVSPVENSLIEDLFTAIREV